MSQSHKIAYKIFDLGVDTTTGLLYPKTLFHGIKGSRCLSVGKWICAERKLVTDGSRQTPFMSGIHAYETIEDVRRWLKNAKHITNRVVVKVSLQRCRKKPRAIRPTLLARKMLISQKEWGKRTPASKYIDGI